MFDRAMQGNKPNLVREIGTVYYGGTLPDHYEAGATALASADRTWLSQLISRRVPLSRWREAFGREDDIKVVLQFGDGA